ncbi:class I SAM-dependent methyltransferase [Alkalicoccobacillus murimartini]|uniref:Ubiquinone/menaquinone biosynthesis C-methylase UbiE n=1 Tax=Alkalicoccobacillus murimartini TaxID=171685 RepID=A0ABT9YC10_9BACI|nr:methyltransferase domain-containing protein [Alkalicoccobacillus murimartini]MDQ0205383.1 ubiquinone/menaquinone biosynthesis C-methylase UbiE [Alkalicoccobacillus murimartini]
MDQRLKRKIQNLDRIERVEADEVYTYLSPKHDDSVLDLGAGTGYISLAIAKHVKSVVAFDFDSDILDYLYKICSQKNITNIETCVGNFKEIPLRTNYFDKAVASISLHEVQPLSLALREIYRVLKDEGLFVCIEIERVKGIKAPRVSSEEMKAEMLKAGFSIEEVINADTKVANQPVYIIVGRKK